MASGKESLVVESFHNGLNTKTDARDILDDNLAKADNISVDDVGRITMSGNKSEITTSGLSLATLSDGYNLFRFSSDYASNGTTVQDTDYLIVWDDTLGKLYWLPNLADNGSANTAWGTATHLTFSDTSDNDWGTIAGDPAAYVPCSAQPLFYYVDGALRVVDGNLSNTSNPAMWIGTVNRTLFPTTTTTSETFAITGWKKHKAELLTPGEGKISSSTPSSGDVPTNGVYWHLRNLREETTSLYKFDDSITAYSDETAYDLTEPFEVSSPDDESWQTSYKGLDGYGDSNYHLFGGAFYEEDDDSTVDWEWDLIYANRFNTDSAITFKSGQSLYLAVRMPGDDNKKMWEGTHTKSLKDKATIAITINDAYLTVYRAESGTSNSDTFKWRIDPSQFTGDTTPSGEWHILEFPFDNPYEKDTDYATFSPQQIKLTMSVSWTLSGDVYTNDAKNNSTFDTEANRKNIPGWDFIQFSDLRVGESELVGVNTVGKQKFLMSYTYDESENESLLYNFGSDANREVVFENTTSAYKIGITSYVKVPTAATFNNRITGANLYMEDDGIPYRIAQLRYLKGLKGAWEAEYPADSQFTTQFSDTANKTTTVKTDGLPLLESYESLNGFKPSISTLAASYKTATLLNRKLYVGNVYQDSKPHGDKMIKSNANSFDIVPSEGKGIEVVVNDGDSIVKLESYADRILQFKKNTMYLINATREAEYLEDTFVGKGISSQSASTKTDIGVAWANENGCYLYDGERVHDLTESKIKETEWQSHITSSTDVIYFPLKKKIFVTGGANGVDIYEYSLPTKSWSKSINKLDGTKTNFVIDNDDAIKYVSSSKKLYKWDDTSSSSDSLDIITRDFTFGNPSIRKKCFKFYITYKCDGIDIPANVKVYYGINGENLQKELVIGTEVSTTSNFAGTSTNCYNSSGMISTDGEWKQAELMPQSSINNIYSIQLRFKAQGTVPSSFEINDITIIYREKLLK